MKKISSFLLALFFCLGIFGGLHVYADGAEKPVQVEDAEAVELSDWEGNYRSVASFMKEEEVIGKLEELAEEAEESLDDFTAESDKMFHTDFDYMEFEGNHIRFYDQNQELLEDSEYRYQATYSATFNDFAYEWYEFASENPDSKHPVLLLMNLHEEEGLMHFHMRYGSSAEELFEQAEWWPTLVSAETGNDQIGMMLAAHAAEEEKEEVELPEAEVLEEIELSLWEGSWNNMASYLKSDELQEAFAKLAENEGVSEDEARIAYKNKRRCEFDSLVIEGNTVSFRDGVIDEKNSDAYSKEEYEYKESYKVKYDNYELLWHVFTSEDEEAFYPNLLMLEVHGDEALNHFHMRYGEEDILALLKKDGWFPTFVGIDSTFEQLSAEITD